MKKYTKYTKL